MPRTALFVIDIQNELAGNPQTAVPGAAQLRAAAEQILSASRSLGGALTVFVQHEESPSSGGTLVRGSEPWKLVFPPLQGAAAADEILVSKTTQNTFESNPDLAERLKDAGIDHIIALGLQSECCVGETCKGALAAGFRVEILQGAHATYDGEDRIASDISKGVDEMLAARGAKVVPWESAVARWKAAGVVC